MEMEARAFSRAWRRDGDSDSMADCFEGILPLPLPLPMSIVRERK
jgi:hypothetical protein